MPLEIEGKRLLVGEEMKGRCGDVVPGREAPCEVTVTLKFQGVAGVRRMCLCPAR